MDLGQRFRSVSMNPLGCVLACCATLLIGGINAERLDAQFQLPGPMPVTPMSSRPVAVQSHLSDQAPQPVKRVPQSVQMVPVAPTSVGVVPVAFQQDVQPAASPPAKPDAAATGTDVPAATGDSGSEVDADKKPDEVSNQMTDYDPAKSKEIVSQRLEALPAEASETLKSTYRDALKSIEQAIRSRGKITQYKEFMSSTTVVETLQAEVEQMSTVEAEADPALGTLPITELQSRDLQLRAGLQSIQEKRDGFEVDLEKLKSRPTIITTRLTAIKSRLPVVRGELNQLPEGGANDTPKEDSERQLYLAQVAQLTAEREELLQEQMSQATRQELLKLDVAKLDQELRVKKQEFRFLQKELEQRLTSQATAAASLVEKNIPNDKEAQELAQQISDLSKESLFLQQCARQVNDIPERIRSKDSQLNQRLVYMKDLINKKLGGPLTAQLLFKLVGDAKYDDRSFELRPVKVDDRLVPVPDLGQAEIGQFSAEEKGRQQARLEKTFAVRTYDPQQRDTIDKLLAAREELIDTVSGQYSSLKLGLSDLADQRQSLAETAINIEEYVEKSLFGFVVRSCDPVGVEDINNMYTAFHWAAQPNTRADFLSTVQDIFSSRPLTTTVFFTLMLLLLLLRPMILKRLRYTGTRIRRVSTDKYRYTVQALLLTFAIAIPLPKMLGYCGWNLHHIARLNEVGLGLSLGLRSAAWIYFFSMFFAAVCIKGGLAEAHFRWNPDTLARIRSSLFLFAVVFVPLSICYSSLSYIQGTDPLIRTSRVAFLLSQIWIAWMLWRIFRGEHGLLAACKKSRPDAWYTKTRVLWCSLLFVAPAFMFVIAAMGFMITASELSLGMLVTICLVVLGVILDSMVLRWFAIKRRRLALEEALERRRERLEAIQEDKPEEKSSDLMSPEEEMDNKVLDLESISEQTRSLVGLMANLVVLGALLWFWTGIIPLADTLTDVRIPFFDLSVASVLAALVLFFVAKSIVTNLPGLLEFTVLRGSSLDSGGRFAVATLIRYALIALFALIFFNLLELDWSKFGWMAAALSVGLGFGLQEIVANFVCGIILLLEQPIRVGDVVTLDQTTGKVMRIQMRATTIRNWDQQDFVVPNKNIITGTFLNWTLSNTVNRLVLHVGIAYGSDTEKARLLLLEIATNHPSIMDDPAPLASVEQMADSSVNLVLRAYLPDMANRVSTTTEIYQQIHDRYAEAGIEIPFPQRDLNLKGNLDELKLALGVPAPGN
ncbi:Miniconductance mechanosensitive channel MscM precursor [Stieleria bergensis]|uniref:Miniconductance mechanosensitive channel MscM n=1 Tax=Stieleria bergensis TaxID=2528025 RepID=A0A517SVV3_9BACT|nr:Miniconductance mechanosensitive channel MscM precursor [Planctomycetes bacterium SV_7m_r]